MDPSTPSLILTKTLERLDGAYAPTTIRAYRADFITLIDYCEKHTVEALPAAETVAAFISALSKKGLKSASIRRALAGISTIHRLNRFPDPTKDPEVSLEMKRMHRLLGRGQRQAQAINKDLLDQRVSGGSTTARDIRNGALLLLAYDTLCRRSELISINVEDIR